MTYELLMAIAMHFQFISSYINNPKTLPSFMVAHNVFNSLLIASPLVQPMIYALRLAVVRRYVASETISLISFFNRF